MSFAGAILSGGHIFKKRLLTLVLDIRKLRTFQYGQEQCNSRCPWCVPYIYCI